MDDNQLVEAGALLVELDPRDYQVAVDKARAELADAEASALAAQSSVPITSTTAASNVTTARGGVDPGTERRRRRGEGNRSRARAARRRAQARLREAEANAAKSARDVERLRGLLAKDEVSQQQFDAASATAEAQKATVDSARSQVAEAEAGIRVAESKLAQARRRRGAGARRDADGADRPVSRWPPPRRARRPPKRTSQQARATLAQAELNLQYTTVKAPVRGIVVEERRQRRPGRAGRPAADGHRPDRRHLGDRQLQGNAAEEHAPGPARGDRRRRLRRPRVQGQVDSIAGATGARFSLLPPENATGNFVKVVQRVPVKIVLDPGQDPEHLLRPGHVGHADGLYEIGLQIAGLRTPEHSQPILTQMT